MFGGFQPEIAKPSLALSAHCGPWCAAQRRAAEEPNLILFCMAPNGRFVARAQCAIKPLLRLHCTGEVHVGRVVQM